MKKIIPREGVFVALAIPTDSRGRILRGALASHIAWLKDRGIHGILALGSTGEFVRFDLDERKALLELIAELAGTLPVIANVSDIRLSVACELGRFARRLKLNGVSIMPPSFYPVSAADQLAYFERVAGAAGLPVMLYNFPELTGNRIGVETISTFAQRAPLFAIKQSGGEFSYHKELIALGGKKKFSVFTGADTRLQEAFHLGVSGCIGGLVNFVPEPMLELYGACRKGTTGDVATASERMRAVGREVDSLSFPLNVAAGIEARGLEPGVPKTAVSKESLCLYRKIVRSLRSKFREWRLPPAGKELTSSRAKPVRVSR